MGDVVLSWNGYARMRPVGMSRYLLLSALAHLLLVLILYFFTVPPQGRPLSPTEQLIPISWLQPELVNEVAPSELAAEIPTGEQQTGDVQSTILPDQPVHIDSQTEAVPAPSLMQERELLQPPDPRPPNPKPSPSAPRRSPSRAAKAERPGDSPSNLPPRSELQPQPRQVRRSTDGYTAELPGAVEPTLPALPESHQRQEHPLSGPHPLSGLAQSRPSGRLPLLHESDLQKYAQLPPPQPGWKTRTSTGVDTVISLNTGDVTYLSYFAHIKQKIEQVWDYPAEAVDRRIEGQLLLLFVLQRSGQVKAVEFLCPSGFKVLDRHAWEAVVNASPFDPIPLHIPQDELRIRARFTYVLDTERQRATIQ